MLQQLPPLGHKKHDFIEYSGIMYEMRAQKVLIYIGGFMLFLIK